MLGCSGQSAVTNTPDGGPDGSVATSDGAPHDTAASIPDAPISDTPVGDRDASVDAPPDDGAIPADMPLDVSPDAPQPDVGLEPPPDAAPMLDAVSDGLPPDMDPCTGVVCDTPPNLCHAPVGTCMGGECTYAPLDGVDCDDGDACTSGDRCIIGTCAGTVADVETVATPPENVHFSATADPDGTVDAFYAADVNLVHVRRPPGGPWTSQDVPIPVDAALRLVASASAVGVLHVIYQDRDGLTYGWFDTVWSFETIESVPFNDGGETGWQPALAVDGSDGVHAVYGRLETGCLKLVHAERVGVDTWNTEVVDARGCSGTEPEIAIGTGGDLHIAYVNATDRKLMHAERPPAGSWTIEEVAEVGSPVGGPALVMDADGNAHLAFEVAVRRSERYLRYGKRGPTGWSFESIDGGDAHGPSIGLDADGAVWVSYLRDLGRSLRLANRGLDSRWRIRTLERSAGLEFPRSITGETALALAPGMAHVVYDWRADIGEPALLDAIVATTCDGPCAIPCGPAATQCDAPEACVDGLCTPVEAEGAACDDGNECTEDRCFGGACVGQRLWSVDVADAEGRWYAAAAADGAGGVHVVSQDHLHTRLRYAHLPAGGSWSAETVDTEPTTTCWSGVGGGTGWGPSIDVGDDGAVHIGYAREIFTCPAEIQTSEIRYAHRAAPGPWTIDIVDPDALRTETALVIGTDGSSVHLIYVGACPTTGLCHSENTGGTFVANVIEDEGDTAIFSPELAMSASGELHAAYLHPREQLRYANRPAGGSWATSHVLGPILSRSLLFEQVSLALDAAGTPHIAVTTDCSLDEIHGDGEGAWTVTNVDTGCDTWNSTPALTVDATETHRMGFLGGSRWGHQLVYAEKAPAGEWTLERTPALWSGIEGCAIAFDASGGLHLFSAYEELLHLGLAACP